jgi:hypothetical protein
MDLHVKINNVPVELEVKKVGPASLQDIDAFRVKLESGELVLVDQAIFEPITKPADPVEDENLYFTEPPVKPEPPPLVFKAEADSAGIVKPRPDPTEDPTEEDEDYTIAEAIAALGLKEVDLKEVFENNKDKIKPWWKSKTIISNGFAAVGCILGTLVADNPEASVYLPASVLAVIVNSLDIRSIWYRLIV